MPEAGHDEHRHRAARPSWLGTVVVGALGLLLVGALLTAVYLQRPGSAVLETAPPAREVPCPDRSLVIAATPAVAPVLEEALADAGCTGFTVTAAEPAEVSQSLTAGEAPPDVWIPDSSLWPGRLAPTTVDALETLLDSLVASPVVVVSGGDEPPATWQDLLLSNDLVLGDPLTDSASAGALLAGLRGLDAADTTGIVVPLAQRGEPPATAAERVAGASEGGLTVASEQAALPAPGDPSLSVPEGSSLVLDHPVLLVTQGGREAVRAPADWLASLLVGQDLADRLAAAGFRTSRGTPGRPAAGAGDVVPIEADGSLFADLLGQWSTLSVPTRALAVIDVSGSMNFDAGDSTRIDLTVAATRGGLDLFPGSASLGLWAFSHRLDGASHHLELAPVRRLDAEVAGSTHRALLRDALAGLPGLADGATALYATTLAAYQAATDGYDHDAVNSVLLFTDGTNEDPFSISQDELVAALEELYDPRRPVRITAIGISADADVDALERIAAATGGAAFVAERPQDMAAVFRSALGARAS